MAYSLTILPEQKIAFFRFWDEISVESGQEAFLSLTRHRDFNPSYLMVTDARDVTRIKASFQSIFVGVDALKDLFGRFEPGALSVILVKDTTQFGFARILEQILDFLSPIKLRVAYDEDELRAFAQRPDLNFADLAVH